MTASMLRWLRLIFLFVLALFLVTVAGANREAVILRLLPPEMERFVGAGLTFEVPLFLVIFVAILLGFALGQIWEYLRAGRHRNEARVQRQQAATLAREVARLKETKVQQGDDILALLPDNSARR